MHARTPTRRRTRAAAAISTIAITAAAWAVGAPPTAAATAPACTEAVPITVSDQDLNIRTFTPGSPGLDVALTGRSLSGLAHDREGTLYGATYSPPALWTIDPETGAAQSPRALRGALDSGAYVFGLMGLPDGNLLGAVFPTAESPPSLYEIDPAAAEASEWAQLPPTLVGVTDLLPLPGGEALLVGHEAGRFRAYRVRRGEPAIRVGTLPDAVSFGGLARSGGTIYMTGDATTLWSLGPIPTEASDDPIPTSTVPVDLVTAPWDASSPADLCTALSTGMTADRPAGSLLQVGEEITYTLTLDDTGGTAHAPLDHVIEVTDLIDDARVTSGPVAAPGSTVAVGPITTTGGRTTFAVTGEVATGTNTTVSFTARITGAGDRRTAVHLLAAGRTPPAACDPGGACVVHRTAAPPPAPGPATPVPEPPPAPTPRPAAPSASAAITLGPATIRALTGTRAPAMLVTQRLELPHAGRHTLVLRDRITGRRLRWLPGSRIGPRTLRRSATAPVHTTAHPGRRVAIRARIAAPARWIRSGRVQLRVILNRPGDPLTDVVLRVTSARR